MSGTGTTTAGTASASASAAGAVETAWLAEGVGGRSAPKSNDLTHGEAEQLELGQIYDSVMAVQGGRGENQPICEKGKCHKVLNRLSEACQYRSWEGVEASRQEAGERGAGGADMNMDE